MNLLADEAGELTADDRRQIADVLQAEGLNVTRWRRVHLLSGLLLVSCAIMTVLGAIDLATDASTFIPRVMVWAGTVGLAFAAGLVWKLAGKSIDLPLGMYQVATDLALKEYLNQAGEPRSPS